MSGFNRNRDANLHVHKVLRNRAVRDDRAISGDVKWAHVIVPAIRGGATVMDDVFGECVGSRFWLPLATARTDVFSRSKS